MNFKADFTKIEPITKEEKEIYDFKIEANNKQEAIKQIKEWFETLGDIRIVKEN